jgi:transcriptional antiterminator RfaH
MSTHPLGSVTGDVADPVRWFAVCTQPKREMRAMAQLENQGFRVFLPRRMKTIRHARKMQNIVAPFFPRYLFVEFDLRVTQWRSVNGTFGVSRIIMQGERPHPVPRGVVESLVACIDEKGLLRLDQHFKVGTKVRLTAGPFAEQIGILDRLDDSGRVRVLLEIMGGPVPVQVPREYVVAA